MPRELILLAVAMFAWGLGEGMFFYFQPIYLQQLGADPIRIGAILGGYGLITMTSHIPAGYLADRVGRKPLLISAWVMGLAATWIMALATDLPLFIAGLFIYGITLFVLSPLFSYVTAARGRLSIGRAITLISASFNLGAVIGPWLGGQIGGQAGLRQNYIFAGVLLAVSTLLIVFLRPQPVERFQGAEARSGWLLAPRYWFFLGAIFLAVFAMYLPQPLAPNFLVGQRHLTLEQIGLLYSAASVGVVILNLVLGSIPARTGFLIAQAAVGAFSLILWKGMGMPWYLLAYFLLGGFKTARNLGIAQVRELAPQSAMGLAFGVAETVSGAATVLAPLLAGLIYDRQPLWIFPLSAGAIGLSILSSARFSPVSREIPAIPSTEVR